jgi:class 3 adenylate cyclase/nitrite reductase/ring-hydroxylating ferredoxin subunit
MLSIYIETNITIDAMVMAKVNSLPDDVEFDVEANETLLEAGLRSGVAFAHACGGRAKCSTCRISVTNGLERCSRRTDIEQLMADRLGLADDVRLACQLRPQGAISVRRLVLDETDLMMCSQLDRAVASRTGETKRVTVFFSDIADFTSISESLSPYDVMYLLNRYFVQVGDIIERNGGFIDKFVGDGVMALFGVDDQPNAPLRAVNTSLQILEAVDRMKPFFASMYDTEFDIRIGLHYGEAVIGSLGSVGHERLTAIGDVVNVASRIENANKEAGTRLLISDDLHEEVKNSVEVEDFVRIRLKGTSDRITLHEVADITPEARTELQAGEFRETMQYAGKKWDRVFPTDELAKDEWRIVEFGDIDVVILRLDEGYHAFNNACPHMHIPLYERRPLKEGDIGWFPDGSAPRPLYSTITLDRGIKCRWHHSCFDLQTGEVREWATRLADDGTSPGWEFIGDVSRSRNKLTVHSTRVFDDHVWISLA